MDTLLRDDIRFINKFLYSIQKHRIALGNWIDAKKRGNIEPSERALKLFKEMTKQEKTAKNMARDIVSLSAIWAEFFCNVRGVGESLSTSLLAEIRDIGRFPTVSSLWAYCGLTSQYVIAHCSNGHKLMMSSDKQKTCPVLVWDNSDENEEDQEEKESVCGGELTIIERISGKAPKWKRGYHYCFNTRLKMTCWKIGEQMVKQGDDFYRGIYDREKEKQGRENPSLTKLHIHNRAKRKMVKIFLAHLWEAWRASEKLEIRTPYVIEKLGHQGYVAWADLKALLKEAKNATKREK